MFALKRNQVIITALVVMICIAGYLNYIDSRNNISVSEGYDLTASGEISAIILDSATGQEVAVVNPWADGSDENAISINNENGNNSENEDTEAGAAVFVSAPGDSSFFVQAKLDREQDRSKQKETLTALLNSSEIDKTTKAECATAILSIQERMDNESATEAMLSAKGFGESYVRIDDNWVEIVINKSVLTDQELAQLEDIVTRLTGMTVEKIRVSSAK